MSQRSVFEAWAARLRSGDGEAARQLVRQFTHSLIALARRRLPGRLQRKVDAEDVVQSVYRSFFRRLDRGRIELRDWSSLRHLLATMTKCKCINQVNHFAAEGHKAELEVPLPLTTEEGDPGPTLASRLPAPDQAAELAETVEYLLRGFEDWQREVVVLYRERYTIPEISERVRYSERAVHRTLERVRMRLKQLQAEGKV
jgi:RNA polymerase sigma-70 factor (ECF subfamily)